MADQSPGLSPPFVSYRTLMTQIERMESEGVPTKIDTHFLRQMAGGTQNHFRHALRSAGLIGEDSRPTPLLYDLVEARQDARAQLFAKIMADRFPGLYGLPPNASKSDFFAVLDGYGVKSADQQRKILTFFVATADAAGLAVSTHIRPTKSHTGPRKPGARRSRKPPARPQENGVTGSTPVVTESGGDTYTLTLPSGPKIVLTVKMDVMRTSVADRNFIFKIVDALRDFGLKPDQASGGEKETAGEDDTKAEDAA